ncbi:MAG: hypothetical protein P1U74_10410 [Legionellaceae bacterium]|nr:hypothetical protein [Legionellaceae bacterium]
MSHYHTHERSGNRRQHGHSNGDYSIPSVVIVGQQSVPVFRQQAPDIHVGHRRSVTATSIFQGTVRPRHVHRPIYPIPILFGVLDFLVVCAIIACLAAITMPLVAESFLVLGLVALIITPIFFMPCATQTRHRRDDPVVVATRVSEYETGYPEREERELYNWY